jgi:ribonuclease HII
MAVAKHRIVRKSCSQQAVVEGDAISVSVVAASVLAKVHRGRMMVELDSQFPGYGLASHKGYRSAEHLAALARLGAQPRHRKCFHPVAQSLLQFD